MSREYYTSKNARCPYYRSEGESKAFRIRCEGDSPGRWIHYVFADKQNMIDHRESCCKKGWRDCPIAKMLEGKKNG